MTKKDKVQLIVIWGLALLAGLALMVAFNIYVNTPPSKAEALSQPAFDHSNCQYPDRWSNPKDGCDNSDPAVPECIKAFSTEQGEKDCIAAFVAENQGTAEKQQAIEEHSKPFKEPVASCSGK
jgi:hypothetical protein